MAPSSSSKPDQPNRSIPTDSLQPPSQSPSGSSRPRSILNISRSSALSPSISANTPLNQLSTSPSNHSVISNATGSQSNYSSALHRLKRVASNASIASSSIINQQRTGEVVPKRDDRKASVISEMVESEFAVQAKEGKSSTLAPPIPESRESSVESRTNTIVKRPRSPQITSENSATKQARRRTWFGFGAEVDEEEDVIMTNDDAKGGREETQSSQGSKDQAAGLKDDAADKDTEMKGAGKEPEQAIVAAKSWMSWRSPEDINNTTGNDMEQVPSYADTIRRYVSGEGVQTGAWSGWPIWRTETALQASQDKSLEPGKSMPEEGEPVAAVHAEEGRKEEVVASTPQPTSLNRWWPVWGGDGRKEDEIKPASTPAEQVKADALTRLGAREAVLNEATRSTWINYFSSRSALPVSEMKDRDRGPEVMRIDSQPPAQPSGSVSQSVIGPSTTKGSKAKDKEASKEGKLAVEGKVDSKRSSLEKARLDPAPPASRPSTPLTGDKEKARRVIEAAAVAKGKKGDMAKGLPTPNLLLPSFEDTFTTLPRSLAPSKGMLEKTLSYLFSRSSEEKGKSTARKSSLLSVGRSSRGNEEDQAEQDSQTRLPRMWTVMGDKERTQTRGCKGVQRVTIIGVHGWFSQGPLRNLFGEPTGTSIKFATMMGNAVKKHFQEAGQTLKDENLNIIALEADGQVSDRVNKSFSTLLNNPKWLTDLLSSDAVFLAAHSQGSVVATHLLARLIEQRHLDPRRTKIALLAMCGIHHGPFTHLRSSVASYYLNTFETPAARELFEFQNSKSPVSMMYAAALRIVINAGVKLVYVASMDDQVVPLYSALNASASHPSILRAIFCDGAAFPRIDFLTNLLSFCVAVRNAGLSDHNLLTLLSASVAGSLYGGAGHSIVYEEPQVYSLAVRYLMEVTAPNSYPTTKSSDSTTGPPRLLLEPFSTADSTKWNSNPFALPWSLRGLLEDEVVRKYFDAVIDKLIGDYNNWTPQTKTLKDIQFRLEPMRLISRRSSSPPAPSTSKL
ncbi:hypothetical protein CBS101457_002232 [Exobasidium rhododendri]|nr:hypothetical protein CBS101457_002232 [Exobasidium rhododendri]